MSLKFGMRTLVLGGQASGKSDVALDLLGSHAGEKLFVATGRARDLAFREQILAHRRSRSAGIDVLEVAAELAASLERERGRWSAILVDSLDFWLFTCRELGVVREQREAFLEVLSHWDEAGSEAHRPADLILVSQETGLGLSPGEAASRAFVRELGGLNRAVAHAADQVTFVAAGLPLHLKGPAF
ncbi:MAG: adenosylcobinamide kinase / adenosylcobinamide-phosphate guanylyltransferase [Desulfovibrionales bacterium]|jgi:adenosylcobinamide kinase/adenosylcobinamide-phosphate guanylyltransferase|nr:adenosylcobinamide kinase / adenosylcobinamide-phosphate guanylyltransferase [Desulfovibrionales bacterium]